MTPRGVLAASYGIFFFGVFRTLVLVWVGKSVLSSVVQKQTQYLNVFVGEYVSAALNMKDSLDTCGRVIDATREDNLTFSNMDMLVQAFSETYTSNFFLAKQFDNNSDYCRYMFSKYYPVVTEVTSLNDDCPRLFATNPNPNHTDDYSTDDMDYYGEENSNNFTNTITTQSWPLVYVFPFDSESLGFRTGNVNIFNENSTTFLDTGQPHYRNFPKNISYTNEANNLIYLVPLRTKDGVIDAVLGVQISTEKLFHDRTLINKYIQQFNLKIAIVLASAGQVYTLFSNFDHQNHSFFTHTSILSSAMAVDVLFYRPVSKSMWFIYLLLGIGLLESVLSAWTRLKNERRGAVARQKTDFLARMSHEIKTPINGIVGMIGLMEEIEDLPPTVKSCVKNTRKSTARLLNILNNVVDMSSIESGQVGLAHTSFKPTVILDVVKDYVNVHGARQNSITVVYSNVAVDELVLGDCDKIRRVLYNLVANSIKNTRGGHICVTVEWESVGVQRATKNSNGNIKIFIRVRDNGKGISKQNIKTIFDPFQNLRHDINTENVDDDTGVGIGLAVAKSFAVAMGGALVCESIPQTKTEFTFTFMVFGAFRVCETRTFSPNVPTIVSPIAASNTPPTSRNSKKNNKPGKNPPLLLVVDDNALNRALLQRIIQRRCPVDCHTSDDGITAIEMCRGNKYDIIFMDKCMPICSGIVATKTIRRSGINSNTCIVFVTADSSHSSFEECMGAGATEFVGKPVNADVIDELLCKYTTS